VSFALIAYWMVGYTRDAQHFANYRKNDLILVSIVISAAFIGNGIGFFCATLFREIARVVPLTNIVMIPLLVLSGVFNRLSSMPEWTSWLQYLSPFRYGTHLVMENQFGDENFGGRYDYKSDLGVNLTYSQNFIVLISLGLSFYLVSFLLLKYFTVRIAP